MEKIKKQLIDILEKPESLDSLEELNLLDNQCPNHPLIKASIIVCKRINKIDFEKDLKYFAFLLSYEEIGGKYFEDDSWIEKLGKSDLKTLNLDLIEYLKLDLDFKTSFLKSSKD